MLGKIPPLLAARGLVGSNVRCDRHARGARRGHHRAVHLGQRQGARPQKQGKLLDARKALVACAAVACGAEIKETCEKRIADINSALPTIVFAPKDETGNDLAHVAVSIDGGLRSESLDGRSFTLDPGKHVFKFFREGHPPIDKEFVLRESEKGRREPVVFGALPLAFPSARAAPLESSPPKPPPDSPGGDGPASSWSSQKSLAVVAGGVGVVGLAVGSVFGLKAKSDFSNQESTCSTSSCGDANQQTALGYHESATNAAVASNIAFGVGAAGLATAAVLWFLAPKKPQAAAAATAWRLEPVFSMRSTGLWVQRSF